MKKTKKLVTLITLIAIFTTLFAFSTSVSAATGDVVSIAGNTMVFEKMNSGYGWKTGLWKLTIPSNASATQTLTSPTSTYIQGTWTTSDGTFIGINGTWDAYNGYNIVYTESKFSYLTMQMVTSQSALMNSWSVWKGDISFKY
ncbi:MAG: hypothetical protein N3B21_00290 [Clostridia bacterium]|nr:hypothetical protein [Clostridia bacterium]